MEYLINNSIELLKYFEPEEGYRLAFSGGKDSIVVKELAKLAKVKFKAYYSITTIDPPPLTKFIKKYHGDVIREPPVMTMWDLIVHKKIPPTRMVRYCCEVLKEGGGEGQIVVTGVRWAESSRRKKSRKETEFDSYGSKSKKAEENRQIFLNSDNDEKRRMFETCTMKQKHMLNPIISWKDEHIWEFIKRYNLPYCDLYNKGYKRLGCIGCPLTTKRQRLKEFMDFPYAFKLYLNAFEVMLKNRESKEYKLSWKSGMEVMKWWTEFSDEEISMIQERINNEIKCKD